MNFLFCRKITNNFYMNFKNYVRFVVFVGNIHLFEQY